MPAHYNKVNINVDFLVTQRILAFLMSNGFFMLGKKTKIEEGYNYIDFDKNFISIQYIEDFPEAIEFMQGIKTDLIKYTKSLGRIKLDFDWNYLGQNLEREIYLDKLAEVFWLNQSSEFIQQTLDYPQLMENPWKIIDYHQSIKNIPVSSDFYSVKTNDFVIGISNSLDNWNYNPYLINNPKANFQWIIKLEGKQVLQGIIYSDGDNLIQEYTFKS